MACQLTMLFASALVVAAVAADTKPASFASWLRQGGQAAVKIAGESDSSYYGVESQHICMKDAWHKNCRTGAFEGTAFDLRFHTTEAVCCSDETYSKYGYGDSKVINSKTFDPSIAMTCEVTATAFWHNKPVVVVEGITYQRGQAKVTCVFKEAAEKCTGFPRSEGVTITVEASIFETRAYSHSPGYPLRFDEDCKAAQQSLQSNIKSYVKAMSAYEHEEEDKEEYKEEEKEYKEYKQEKQYKQYKEEEEYEKKPIYFGTAHVFTGPITSVNGGKEHKWVGGWFEQVTHFESKQVDEVELEHAPWIHPNSYSIDLLKKSKATY